MAWIQDSKYVKCWVVQIKILRVLILFADAFLVDDHKMVESFSVNRGICQAVNLALITPYAALPT